MKLFDQKYPNPKRRFWLASDDDATAVEIVSHFPEGKVLEVDQILANPNFKHVNPMGLGELGLSRITDRTLPPFASRLPPPAFHSPRLPPSASSAFRLL